MSVVKAWLAGCFFLSWNRSLVGPQIRSGCDGARNWTSTLQSVWRRLGPVWSSDRPSSLYLIFLFWLSILRVFWFRLWQCLEANDWVYPVWQRIAVGELQILWNIDWWRKLYSSRELLTHLIPFLLSSPLEPSYGVNINDRPSTKSVVTGQAGYSQKFTSTLNLWTFKRINIKKNSVNYSYLLI